MPHFYFFYMCLLLLHRSHRDESKCTAKYGPVWEEYCRLVPWNIMPGIF